MLYNKLSKKGSGFTLIELSVVIAIITVLASIAIPNVRLYMKKSRDAKRISDIQVLTLAIESFYDDNGHYPGPGDDAEFFPPPDTTRLSNRGECIGTRGQAFTGSQCDTNRGNRTDMALDQLLRQYIRGPIPRDPLYSNRGDEFYYSYDPRHRVNWPTNSDTCAGIVAPGDTLALLGFNQSETNSIERHRDTCRDGDINLDTAYYNIAFPEEGLQP